MFDVISPSEESGDRNVSAAVDATQKPFSDGSLQRSRGVLDLVFAHRDGRSYAARAFQQGALKVRFPNVARDTRPEAVILNTAGGLAGDDRLDMGVKLNAGATAVVTSQACEKIYGALGDPAQVRADITLEGAARLEWLPQPMIFFDGARLRRETRVEMAADASLLAVEGVVFGRAAMGESVERGELSDALTIRRGGRLVHVDRFDVKDEIGRMLDRQTVLDGNRAMATTRYVASDAEARLDEMRDLLGGSACPAAVSAWNGMMLMRHVAPDSYTLNKELIRVLSAFRKEPMPRVWSI